MKQGTPAVIGHHEVGPILFDSFHLAGGPRRGHIERNGRAVIAVPVSTSPPPEVLDRLSEVDHPGLVDWLGLFVLDDELVAITTYAGGGSLLARAQQRQLSEAETARMILSLVPAIAALAEVGLSHGDVTPANIVLDTDGQPMLTDLHDCVIADGSTLTRATPGFEGTLLKASARNDLSALTQVIDFVTGAPCTWSRPGLRDAHELLTAGNALTERVVTDLEGEATERIEVLTSRQARVEPVDMTTRRFGPRPRCSIELEPASRTRRTLVAAALLSAALTGAVLLSEQQPPCDDTACASQLDD